MTASIISRVIDAAAAGAGAGDGCLESRVWRVTTSGAGCVGAAAGSRRVLGWGTLNTGPYCCYWGHTALVRVSLSSCG